jgi:hypothetical protein
MTFTATATRFPLGQERTLLAMFESLLYGLVGGIRRTAMPEIDRKAAGRNVSMNQDAADQTIFVEPTGIPMTRGMTAGRLHLTGWVEFSISLLSAYY